MWHNRVQGKHFVCIVIESLQMVLVDLSQQKVTFIVIYNIELLIIDCLFILSLKIIYKWYAQIHVKYVEVP